MDSEQAIATCVAEKLTALGFQPHMIGDSEHPSVICHHQAATATKTIWLQSHLDTAPVGDRSQWHHDPFAGTIVGARIYGRGVADSKAAIALFIYLAKAWVYSFHPCLRKSMLNALRHQTLKHRDELTLKPDYLRVLNALRHQTLEYAK